MSVFNDPTGAVRAIQSVLEQTYRDFEVLVIDDGSGTECRRVLEGIAGTDGRVRLLRNEHNIGLTKSLIRGCAEAQGRLIARQDAGDQSRPLRLARQVELFDSHSNAVLVACHNRFVEQSGEWLFTTGYDRTDITSYLTTDRIEEIQSPVHASVVFRKDAYVACGGYDADLPVAQDFDLWLRMTRFGRALVVREELYEVLVDSTSVSSLFHDEQRRLKVLLHKKYRGGLNRAENLELKRYGTAGRKVGVMAARVRRSRGAYFIGSCMVERNRRMASRYFYRAVVENPFNVKAWLRLVQGIMGGSG